MATVETVAAVVVDAKAMEVSLTTLVVDSDHKTRGKPQSPRAKCARKRDMMLWSAGTALMQHTSRPLLAVDFNDLYR